MVRQIPNSAIPNLAWTAGKVALIYLFVGSVWIIFSDYLLFMAVGTTRSFYLLQTIKGWFYMTVTSGLLYLLVFHYLSVIHTSEESLRRQELNFKDLAESITDVFYALDKNFRVVYWNKVSENLTGISGEDIIGKSIFDVFPDAAKTLQTKAREVLQTGKSAMFVDEHFRNNRRYIFDASIYRAGDGVSVILKDITERRETEEALKKSFDTLKVVLDGTINALASIAERRDPSVPVHQKQVSRLAAAIGGEMGLSEDRIEALRVAGLLHDIGKIAVPAEILARPGHLSDSEFSIVKTYPEVSHEILEPIKFPWPVAEIVLEHQEKLDGSGYPRGMKDDQIMLEARILSVANCVEAMSSHRPYRASIGIKGALESIKRGRGTVYDPLVVDATLRLFDEKKFSL